MPTIDIERAAIAEYCGGLPRAEAERLAVIEPQPEPNMLAAALSYAARGWLAFPCHTMRGERCTCGNPTCTRPAKHPRTRHGLKDATTEEKQIRSWWSRWPDANVAIATGAVSGLLVLDVDPYHGGDLSLLELIDEKGAIDYVAHVVTGSGGDHYYLRHPGGHVPNRIGFRPGLDIRGDGGYVIAPPSLHACGDHYVMCNAPLWGAAPKGDPRDA